MNAMDREQKQRCSTCVQTKMRRYPRKTDLVEHNDIITVHADICDPMQKTTYSRMRYFLTMIATFQRYVKVHLLKTRSKISEYCFEFIAGLERNPHHKVK